MRDLIGVVEAAYQLEPAEDVWLRSVVDAAAPQLDQGLGILGLVFDARDPSHIAHRTVQLRGKIAEDQQLLIAIGSDASGETMRRLMWRAGCSTASQILGRPKFESSFAESARRMREDRGCFDWLQVNAVDPTRVGCQLGVPMPVTGAVPARRRHAWSRIATHIAAALRLRIAADGAERPIAEAILSPRGRVVHAEGDATRPNALDALQSAAVACDRARGKLRRTDPETALAIWKALVSGRWSLVDHFDSDGRRFLIARRNDTAGSDPRALSLRERQVAGLVALGQSNKMIAYALGLSVSRVATLIVSVARKLGARTRVELVTTVQALGGAADAIALSKPEQCE
jgi:DNA-binding NarL/FixJ family response regulator